MNNNRRRNYRSRPQKNNFRRRNGIPNATNSSSFNSNGNKNFIRNGSMNNLNSVEKAMHKFQQLAKDAQSSGDPILAENYLQHADHFLRRYKELSDKNKSIVSETKDNSKEAISNNDSDQKESSQTRS